jgi:DNA-binding transcriptional LysR family regulator
MKRRVADPETSSADLPDLRAFCLVADIGSITGAARALGETKGSVSRRLTRLERALGVALLRRSPRLVQVTEDGQAYRARVGRAIELLDEAALHVQHARALPRGHLRVTAPFDLGVSILPPLVARFSERFPDVSIELLLTEALLDFDAHQIDVALRAAFALEDSSLIAHKLDDVEARLFASPGYIDQHGLPRRPDDLERHRLMLFRATRGVATLTLRRGEEKPLRMRLRAAISASDFSFSRETALAGGGIAVLPTLLVRRDLEEGTLVPVLPEYVLFQAGIYLVHPAARFPSSKVRAFRDFVVEAFAGRRRARAGGGA